MGQEASGDEVGRVRARPARRLAISAALFSLATGLSRLLGLLREVVSARLLGVRGVANDFTNAGQVPNVVRSLVADAALGAAFVPIFSELIDRGEERRAWRVASTVFTVAAVALSAATVVFEVYAEPILEATGYATTNGELTVTLARILFPTVVLLGLSGVVNAVLNAFDEFFVPAVAPVFWNLTIVAFLAAAFATDSSRTRVLLLTWGVLVGTVVQFVLPLPQLRHRGGRLRPAWAVRDPLVRHVFLLMLPITLGLGLINVNVAVDVFFANRLDPDYAPAAIDKAFRVYMLPQGMFSVAVAAVLFPTLARLANAGDLPAFRRQVVDGARQILFLLVPAAAACAVLATPMVRLLYERGAFRPDQTPGVAHSLAAFSLGLAANGVILLLNRSFFSLRRPWLPTLLAVANLALNAVLDALLYPSGVWGIPLATSLVNLVAVAALWLLLRRQVGSLGARAVLAALARILVASALLAAVAYGAWRLLDTLLGRSTPAQAVSLGVALVAGAAVYVAAARALRLGEVELVAGLVRRRLRRAPSTL